MGRGKSGKGKSGGEGDGEQVEVKRPWLIRNLETGKSAIVVEEDTPAGKRFKRIGKAKGKDQNN